MLQEEILQVQKSAHCCTHCEAAGHQPSPRAVSRLCHCLLVNNKSKCHLCAVLQPTPSSGPKCKPHSLGQEQAVYAWCFPYPAKLEALPEAALGPSCQDPAPTPSQEDSLPRVPTAPALGSRDSPCYHSALCLPWRIGKVSLFFFFLQGVLVLKIKPAEKGICRFCYCSQVFVVYFAIQHMYIQSLTLFCSFKNYLHGEALILHDWISCWHEISFFLFQATIIYGVYTEF